MKTNVFLVVWVLSLTGSLLLIGCATAPTEEIEPLVGSWANEEVVEYGKYTYSPKGTLLYYSRLTDRYADSEARYTIEEMWTDDGGNIYYKVVSDFSSIPYDESSTVPWYALHKIHPSGDVMEFSASRNGYPEEISSGFGEMYKILYRQVKEGERG